MMSRVLCAVLGMTLLAACGGGPKKAWDRALGRNKKDKPFEADVSRLKGAYTLSSVKKWEGSGSTTYGVGWNADEEETYPNITLYFKDGGVEIASRTDAPLKTCGVLQPVSQGPSNHLEIAASEACEALSLEIVQQDTLRFTVAMAPFACPRLGTGMCTGLEFESAPDFRIGELMYGWPTDLAARMPSTIKSLQYPDVAVADLESARASFKEALTAASVSLNQDLALTWMGGFPSGYGAMIVNGKVFSRDELIENAVSQAGTFDTQCAVISQKQKAVQKFQRKLAKLEVTHINRAEGQWVYSQLHEGLDTVLTAEQKRVPSENKFPTTEIKNSVSFTVEAADSEKNGNGIMSDHDLQITCDKDRRAGPISIEDLKKALGDVIIFSK